MRRRFTRAALAAGLTDGFPLETGQAEVLANPFDELLERSLEMIEERESQELDGSGASGGLIGQPSGSERIGGGEFVPPLRNEETRNSMLRLTRQIEEDIERFNEEDRQREAQSQIKDDSITLGGENLKKVIDAAISKSFCEAQDQTFKLLNEQAKNLDTMHSMVQTITGSMKSMSNRIGMVEKSTLSLLTRKEKDVREEENFDDPSTSSRRRTRFFDDRQERQTQGDRRQGHRVDVHKWNVKFDGTAKSMTVESFIFRIETLQKKNNMTNDDIFANFHHFVTGPAEKWYWQFMEENEGDEGLNFYDLKSELLGRFKNNKTDHEILRAILDRRQLPNESFDDYYEDIRSLTLQMRTRPKEEDLVAMVRQNLKDRVATMIFGCTIRDIKDLREECRRAEKHLATRDFRIRRQISEIQDVDTTRDMIDFTESEDEQHVAALQNNRIDRQHTNFKTDRRNQSYKNIERERKTDDKDKPTTSITCPSTFHALTCFSCGQSNLALKCSTCQGNVKFGSVPEATQPNKTPAPETKNLKQ